MELAFGFMVVDPVAFLGLLRSQQEQAPSSQDSPLPGSKK
jgi:hypothetical protein